MDWLQLAIAGGLAFVMLFLGVAIFGALARGSEGSGKLPTQELAELARHVGELVARAETLERVLMQELPQLTRHAGSLVRLADDRSGKLAARLDELEARVGEAQADEVGTQTGEEADHAPDAEAAAQDGEEQDDSQDAPAQPKKKGKSRDVPAEPKKKGKGRDAPAVEGGHVRLRNTAKLLIDRAAAMKKAGTRTGEEADRGPDAEAAAGGDEEQGDSRDAPAEPEE
ncbi:MAG: hypothetical protein ACYTFI_18635 [Planctomycetota bacterium]|jgi:hypothetical protein